MRLPEGFHALRVPIPNNPLEFLLSYLIEGNDGLTLIDTGWNSPEAFASLSEQLSWLGFSVRDVRQVVLTHMHPDHCGLASRIRDESGAKLFCHKMEYAMISRLQGVIDREEVRSQYQFLCSCGLPAEALDTKILGGANAGRLDWPMPDVVLSGGEIIDAGSAVLEVIWTPGHAEGHICLYDRENRVLFAGDHVLPVTTPNISIMWSKEDDFDPLGDYLASLEKLKGVKVNTVLPAHDHIFEDLESRLVEIERHHRERLREIEEAILGSWQTPYEAARKVTWTIGPFDSLENLMKMMATMETLAHLEFLFRRGHIARKEEKGVVFYCSGI